jgi:hypothetical protein
MIQSGHDLLCCALNARGEVCGQPANYACSELHSLCPNHAVKTTGRRKTDRHCRVCMRSGRVNDVIALRDAKASFQGSDDALTRSGECVAAYDALHRCRRRAIFVCKNGHGSCRGHVGFQFSGADLRRSCSICGAELGYAERTASALLTGSVPAS